MSSGPFPNADSIDLIALLAMRALLTPQYCGPLTTDEAYAAEKELLDVWAQDAISRQKNLLGIEPSDNTGIAMFRRTEVVIAWAEQARESAGVAPKPLKRVQQELAALNPEELAQLTAFADDLVHSTDSDIEIDDSNIVIFPENLESSAGKFNELAPHVSGQTYKRWRLHQAIAELLLRDKNPQLYEDMVATTSHILAALPQTSDGITQQLYETAFGVTFPVSQPEATGNELNSITSDQDVSLELRGHQYLYLGFASLVADQGIQQPGDVAPVSPLVDAEAGSVIAAGRSFAAKAVEDLGWPSVAQIVLDPTNAPSVQQVLGHVKQPNVYDDWLAHHRSRPQGLTP